MKILLKEFEEKSYNEITFDQILYLPENVKFMYEEKINNNDILKFLDFLLEKIEISNENQIYYFSNNPRVWSYIILFSYINKNIRLFYKTQEIKESNILRLDLKNIGFTHKDLKKNLSMQEYEKLPDFLRNLYYCENIDTEKKVTLSKIGEIYVENIKN